MIAKGTLVKPPSTSVFAIAVDFLLLLAVRFLIIALTGRFPFSGVYSSPFGVIKIGPKPSVWVALCSLFVLARIALRQECGHITGLFTHPTPARLFLVALFIYNANGRQLGAVDTMPARLLPDSILIPALTSRPPELQEDFSRPGSLVQREDKGLPGTIPDRVW